MLTQSVRCARCAIPSSCARTVQESNSHLDILEARRVTEGKGYTEDTMTFRDTAGTLVAWEIWRPEFVHPCIQIIILSRTRRPAVGPTQALNWWVPGVNRPGREDTHSVYVPMEHRATEAPSAHVSVLHGLCLIAAPHACSIAEKAGICRDTSWQLGDKMSVSWRLLPLVRRQL